MSAHREVLLSVDTGVHLSRSALNPRVGGSSPSRRTRACMAPPDGRHLGSALMCYTVPADARRRFRVMCDTRSHLDWLCSAELRRWAECWWSSVWSNSVIRQYEPCSTGQRSSRWPAGSRSAARRCTAGCAATRTAAWLASRTSRIGRPSPPSRCPAPVEAQVLEWRRHSPAGPPPGSALGSQSGAYAATVAVRGLPVAGPPRVDQAAAAAAPGRVLAALGARCPDGGLAVRRRRRDRPGRRHRAQGADRAGRPLPLLRLGRPGGGPRHQGAARGHVAQR
jgi:hypothetical protein